MELRCKTSGVKGRTLTLKMRLADFHIITRSQTLPAYVADAETIGPLARRLYLDSGMTGQKLRLLGVGLSNLDTENKPAPVIDDRQLVLPLAEGE